eukprot:gb/GECG01015470.1/.p1 GENE.gb/GECG01015470.1/~~gb/GECG01015470.1/.p1  ORF type:complete len:803 (+),score=105.47 gb/GECG01015470.1/:1-2409(+)
MKRHGGAKPPPSPLANKQPSAPGVADPRKRRQQAVLQLIMHHLSQERFHLSNETLKQEYNSRYAGQPTTLSNRDLENLLEDGTGRTSQSPLMQVIDQDKLDQVLRNSHATTEPNGAGFGHGYNSQAQSASSPKRRGASRDTSRKKPLIKVGSSSRMKARSEDGSSNDNFNVAAAITTPKAATAGNSHRPTSFKDQRKSEEQLIAECIDPPNETQNSVIAVEEKGQAPGGKGTDGSNQPVIRIKAATMDSLVELLFDAIGTTDQEKKCGLAVTGYEVTASSNREDLQLGDLVFSTMHKMFETLAEHNGYHYKATSVGPCKLFVHKMLGYFDKYCITNEDIGYVLVLLRVARFWLGRHCHRVPRMARAEIVNGIKKIMDDASPLLHEDSLADMDSDIRDLVVSYKDEVQDLLALAKKALTFDSHKRLSELRKEFRGDIPMSAFEFTVIPSGCSHRFRSRNYDLPTYKHWVSVPPKLLAAAWTFGEWCLFRNIPLHEFLDAGWDDPRYTHTADAVFKFVDRYQADSLWVANEIVRATTSGSPMVPPSVRWDAENPPFHHGTPKDRAAMIVRFVTVATELRKIRNFCGLSAILQGLRLKGLHNKLPETWELVPEKTKNEISRLSMVVSDSKQYELYHQATESIENNKAIVPHLAAHTTRLTMYSLSAFPDLVNEDGDTYNHHSDGTPLLHVAKWRKVYTEVLGRLLSWQERTYSPAEMLPTVPKEKRPRMDCKNPVIEPPPEVVHLLESQLYRCFFEFDDDRAETINALVDEAEELEQRPAPQQTTAATSSEQMIGFQEAAMASVG